jgi:hypothetical protein
VLLKSAAYPLRNSCNNLVVYTPLIRLWTVLKIRRWPVGRGFQRSSATTAPRIWSVHRTSELHYYLQATKTTTSMRPERPTALAGTRREKSSWSFMNFGYCSRDQCLSSWHIHFRTRSKPSLCSLLGAWVRRNLLCLLSATVSTQCDLAAFGSL